MRTQHVDVAVIGAGTAGMAAWHTATQAGASAVLIEAGAFGTTCARVGCMPSKLLLAVANGVYDARQLRSRGVDGTAGLQVDGQLAMQFVRRERDHFVASVLKEIASLPQECLLRGRARFAASASESHRLMIDDAWQIEARSVVIATGATPHVPPEFKVFGERLFTSDTIFEIETLPRRLAVFGAGPLALELAQGLSRLGVDVRVFGRDGEVAGITDKSVRDALKKSLASEFYFDPDTTIQDMLVEDGIPTIRFLATDGLTRREQFDAVLVATGRRPALKPLLLEHAGVEMDDHGTPCFDPASMQCGSSSIFVAGDCDGSRPWLQDASDEGQLAGANAARFPDVERVKRKVPFSVVFCQPQVATIGPPISALDEKDIVTGFVSFEDQGRSRIEGQAHGALRLYAEVSTGRLIGAQLCGPQAEHLGHLLAWAVQLSLCVDEVLALPFYHPVVEEGLRTALRDAGAKLHAKRGASAPHMATAVGC
ncbi:dihydrolipoyl dehydrogenase [Paraburkholderia sp. DHOC27]|uniref:dihydrolipoyl dehydrogenase n=1 Tax=Paraburkholderia sp. DHOC27 TaxID=2303330 RepID=UPI000E3D15EE|nr:dihydrolipoyl dehydrogenase [Paraburkholderia sp. DHOC27]RFU44496.1 dihydrolipoyl dehydrogenase [Paraburkholderia sp. DHOC27]